MLERRLAGIRGEISRRGHPAPAALVGLSGDPRDIRVLAEHAVPAARPHRLHQGGERRLDGRQAVSLTPRWPSRPRRRRSPRSSAAWPARSRWRRISRWCSSAPIRCGSSRRRCACRSSTSPRSMTRRRFALRELELNQPAAPGLYRDVVPIVRRADGSLALGDAPETGLPRGRLGAAHGARSGGGFPRCHCTRRPVDRRRCSMTSAMRWPPIHGACRPPPASRWRDTMRWIADGNVALGARCRPAGRAGAGLVRRRCSAALAGIAAWQQRARPRRLRPPRARRSASRQSLPLARQAGAVRCARVRRGGWRPSTSAMTLPSC